jgi:hypothetical protein
MKNLVSIFAGHDSNISFYHAEKDEYHTIEIERLVKKRYFRLHEDNTPLYQKDVLNSVEILHGKNGVLRMTMKQY